MNEEQALKIISEAGKRVVKAKMDPADDLESFFDDVNAALDKFGYGVEYFEDFEGDLEDSGSTVLFTEDRDVDNLDALYDQIDRKISKIKRELSRKWEGFDIDSDGEDEEIYVTLTVDSLSDEI